MKHVFSRTANGRARAWRTARALGVVSALVLVAAPSATSDDGLPPGANQIKGVAVSTGVASAAPAKQFFRVPVTRLWADSDLNNPETGAQVSTYAVSPPGAPHPYGYFPPITVRTLAFGLIPAEVTITIAQLRQEIPDVDTDGTALDPNGPAAEDVPVPWVLIGPPISVGDHRLEGSAELRLTSLTLDGVKVPVGDTCRTQTPIEVHLLPRPGYIPVSGGGLYGTIDVPAFTGCGTGGEDLNPLMTSMVSGTGNSLEIRQSRIEVGEPIPGKLPEPKIIPETFPLPER